MITIENALKQLQVLGISKAEIIIDNGYYSEKNLAELRHAHFDFITLIKTNIKWGKKELDSRLYVFHSTGSACPFDTNTHGLTVALMREFSRPRKYASTRRGFQKEMKRPFAAEYICTYISIRFGGWNRMPLSIKISLN